MLLLGIYLGGDFSAIALKKIVCDCTDQNTKITCIKIAQIS